MIAYRITKAKRATDLSGKGAALEGGRWNSIDIPAIYMGLSPAICCLETFVHTTHYPTLPLIITRFVLPANKSLYFQPNPNELPENWAALPADQAGMAYGSAWLNANRQLGLIVPSAVMPLENNIVINPAHPAVERIQVDQQFKFMYDARMFEAR